MDDTSGGTTVNPSAQGQKVTLSSRSTQVVPKPTSRPESDLLFGSMIVDVLEGRFVPVKVISFATIQTQTFDSNTLISLGLDGLHSSTALSSVSTDCFEIQGSRDHLDVGQGELRTLCDDLSVESDEGGSIVVQPVSIATLLVGIEVDTSELLSRRMISSESDLRHTQRSTLRVASLISSTRVYSFRNSW
jgi:hypothetical protein